MYANKGHSKGVRQNSEHKHSVLDFNDSWYAQLDQFKEAIEFFREMQMGGFATDATTIDCTFCMWSLGCSGLGEMDLNVRNTLIGMYSKCGDTLKAFEIFHGLTQPVRPRLVRENF